MDVAHRARRLLPRLRGASDARPSRARGFSLRTRLVRAGTLLDDELHCGLRAPALGRCGACAFCTGRRPFSLSRLRLLDCEENRRRKARHRAARARRRLDPCGMAQGRRARQFRLAHAGVRRHRHAACGLGPVGRHLRGHARTASLRGARRRRAQLSPCLACGARHRCSAHCWHGASLPTARLVGAVLHGGRAHHSARAARGRRLYARQSRTAHRGALSRRLQAVARIRQAPTAADARGHRERAREPSRQGGGRQARAPSGEDRGKGALQRLPQGRSALLQHLLRSGRGADRLQARQA